MESQLRAQMPYTRNVPEYHSRRISSCSSASASSSSYASSEDNMFVHRHMENNNIPQQIDTRHHGHNSHVNRAYHHEERLRPQSVVSSDSELAELERDSSYLRRVSQKLKGPSCTNCCEGSLYSSQGTSFYSPHTQQNDLMSQQEPCSRGTEGELSASRQQFGLQGELMNGRPLPLTPESELRSNGAVTPLRYQNDSPFVSAARTLNRTQSPGSGKRSTTSSPSAQVNQTAAEKQRSAEELLKQVPWFKPKMSRELVLESLAREDLGSFIIRESSTHNTCFALSVKVPKFNNPTGIAHYIIHRTPSQGFKIKGLEKEWSNLSSLVIHHTIMPELLPCTLKIPHPVSSRRPSTTSRNSSSSRGSSNSASPTLNSSAASGSIDRLAIGLDKKLNVTHEGAV